MFGSLFRCGGLLCKVQSDIILLPLIGEGRDGEFPVRAFFVTPAFESESPSNSEGFKLFSPFTICPIMRLWISSAYRLTRPHFAAAVRFVKFRMTKLKPLTLTLSPSGQRTKCLFQSVKLCDSGSHLDYSGCRKTHRFPPPYGLGSLSLTHRPTENPTGMT